MMSLIGEGTSDKRSLATCNCKLYPGEKSLILLVGNRSLTRIIVVNPTRIKFAVTTGVPKIDTS